MALMLKQIRERKSLSQKDVADAIGVSIRRYGSWERGERNMNLEDAAMIADVLDCSLDELAGREWPHGSVSLDRDEGELLANYRASTPERKRLLSLTAQDCAAMSKEAAECGKAVAEVAS